MFLRRMRRDFSPRRMRLLLWPHIPFLSRLRPSLLILYQHSLALPTHFCQRLYPWQTLRHCRCPCRSPFPKKLSLRLSICLLLLEGESRSKCYLCLLVVVIGVGVWRNLRHLTILLRRACIFEGYLHVDDLPRSHLSPFIHVAVFAQSPAKAASSKTLELLRRLIEAPQGYSVVGWWCFRASLACSGSW